jgi:REP element-mobilizing transposase RayT
VFCQTCDQGKFRMVHYSVQRNHLHLVIEAKDRAAMSKGMQRIGIRIALQLNKAMGRRSGRVLCDRYHEQHLESPRQVRNALGYVLNNFRKHLWKDEKRRCEKNWVDPFSSAEFFDGWKDRPPLQVPLGGPVTAPRTWLLTEGWRRSGLLPCDLIPTSAGARTTLAAG